MPKKPMGKQKKRKPKVLIDVFYQLKASTGIRTYTNELVLGLSASQPNSQYELTVYPKLEKVNSIPFFRLDDNKFKARLFHLIYFMWKQLILPVICLTKRIDLLICTDYVSPTFVFGFKNITVVHSPFFWQQTENYSRAWLTYFKRMTYSGLKKNSIVVTTSSYTKRSLTPILKTDAPIEVVYQSPKINELKSLDPKVLPYDLNGVEMFLHVGYFDKRKNLTTLIKAFANYRTKYKKPKSILVLAGGQAPDHSNDFPNIKLLIEQLGLNASVHLPGHVSEKELSFLYQNASAYIFPSSNEGFGIPVLEAFHYGIPTIISNQEALMEVGGDGVLIFDTFDADDLALKLHKLMSDEELKANLIRRGSDRLEFFSRENFVMQFEKLIHQTLST